MCCLLKFLTVLLRENSHTIKLTPLKKKKRMYLLEGKGGRKREGNIDRLQPGMCPDQESNWQPSGLQDNVQPTEPHQLGQNSPV